MFKGMSQCMPTVGISSFGPLNSIHDSPLPLFLPSPIFQQLSMHVFISLMLCNITDALSFSFPEFYRVVHNYKHVLHMSLCMIMLVFMYMFIFGSIFHVWEKTCSLCVSEAGLFHITWCPPIASTYLQTICHYSLWLSDTSVLHIPYFLDPFISCRVPGLFPKLGYCE
jgi:hypothetical protein